MAEKGYPGEDRTERVGLPRLYDIREHWSNAPEVPLAHTDPENIITDTSLVKWKDQLNNMAKRGYVVRGLEKYNIPVLLSELLQEYKSLHFLSRRSAENGMAAFVKDIKENFDPKETLIYQDTGSVRFFYEMVKDKLADYGTFRERGRQGIVEILDKGKFLRGDPHKAKTWVHMDDWILTGEQFGNGPIQIAKDRSQVFSYFLVVSDRGKSLFDKAGLRGKTVYKLRGDDGAGSFFGNHRIYGFHKIPDTLPEIFAGSDKTHEPDYSIFPAMDGRLVGRHSRLVDY